MKQHRPTGKDYKYSCYLGQAYYDCFVAGILSQNEFWKIVQSTEMLF